MTADGWLSLPQAAERVTARIIAELDASDRTPDAEALRRRPVSAHVLSTLPPDVLPIECGPGRLRRAREEDIDAALPALRRRLGIDSPHPPEGYETIDTAIRELGCKASTMATYLGTGKIANCYVEGHRFVNTASRRRYQHERAPLHEAQKAALRSEGLLIGKELAAEIGWPQQVVSAGHRLGFIPAADTFKRGRREFPLFEIEQLGDLSRHQIPCQCRPTCDQPAWIWSPYARGHRNPQLAAAIEAERLARERAAALSGDDRHQLTSALEWAQAMCEIRRRFSQRRTPAARQGRAGRPPDIRTVEEWAAVVSALATNSDGPTAQRAMSADRRWFNDRRRRIEIAGAEHKCQRCRALQVVAYAR